MIFQGAGVAMITPMKANNEVDYEKLEELINFQITSGTACIVIASTTGESATLTMEEKAQVIKAAITFTKKRVPVVAGIGSNCTITAIKLAQEAEAAGADGLLAITPYCNVKTQKGVITHYTQIAEAVKVPIIMYNVPSRTGCNMTPETAAYLFHQVKNIKGLKEASGDIVQAAKIMDLTDGRLDLYSGEDSLVVPLMEVGAKGVISVWSNLAPRKVQDMCQSFFMEKIDKARKMQREALPLIEALFCEVNPIPVKKALNLMGMSVGAVRAPLYEMEEEKIAKLAKAMNDYGIKMI